MSVILRMAAVTVLICLLTLTTTHGGKVNGGWTEWTNGTCSTTCGFGTMLQTRSCTNPAPFGGGSACAGDGRQAAICNVKPCESQVNGGWTEWVNGECRPECGIGTQLRTRSCTNPTPSDGGDPCIGDTLQPAICNLGPCKPTQGFVWTSWVAGQCSVSCGQGSTIRTRSCTKPALSGGAQICTGLKKKADFCNVKPCPVPGGWSQWTTWSTCPVTCGGAQQTRTRPCNNPPPSYGGAMCQGNSSDFHTCGTNNCPMPDGWSQWTAWSSCPVTCGGAQQNRTRTCNNSPSSYEGATCQGDNVDTQTCGNNNCQNPLMTFLEIPIYVGQIVNSIDLMEGTALVGDSVYIAWNTQSYVTQYNKTSLNVTRQIYVTEGQHVNDIAGSSTTNSLYVCATWRVYRVQLPHGNLTQWLIQDVPDTLSVADNGDVIVICKYARKLYVFNGNGKELRVVSMTETPYYAIQLPSGEFFVCYSGHVSKVNRDGLALNITSQHVFQGTPYYLLVYSDYILVAYSVHVFVLTQDLQFSRILIAGLNYYPDRMHLDHNTGRLYVRSSSEYAMNVYQVMK